MIRCGGNTGAVKHPRARAECGLPRRGGPDGRRAPGLTGAAGPLAALCALLLSACAPGPIRHVEFPNMPVLASPQAVPIALSVDDGRPPNQAVHHIMRVQFGVVERSSGPEPALDPPDQLRSVRNALTEALGRRGFPLAAEGRAMQVTVLDLHGCSRWERRNPALLAPGTLTVTPAEFMVASRVLLRVTVRDAAGRETFQRDYEAGSAGVDYRTWPAARRLDEALTAVAAAIVQDGALLAALQSAGTAREAQRPEPLRVGDYRPSC